MARGEQLRAERMFPNSNILPDKTSFAMVSGMDWEPTSVMGDAGDESAQSSSSSSSSINGNVNGSMNGAAKPAAVREVTAADRERARAAKEMGNDAFRAGRHADAVRLYSEAINTDPSEAAYFTNRAAAYMSLHKYQDALEDCNQAASMQTSEPNVKTLTRLARCQLHVGHLDVAKATVQRALAIAPRDSAAMTLDAQIDRTTTHIAAFERYRDEKSYQLANIALDKVAVEVPVLPLAWRLMRADLYLRRNQLEKANSAAYDALRHSPSDPEALVLRAKVLLAMGSDLSKALQHAQAALRADPEHKTAIRLLRKCRKLETAKEDANAAFKAGKTEESVSLYTAALDMAMPKDAEEVDARGYRAIVYSNRANANAKLGKHDEAIADCTESLQLNDGYVKALRLRARSYLAVERYEEAVDDFKKAIEESSAAEAEPLKRELHNAEIDLKRSKKKDYYKILGVSKTATGVEIKKAYRKESLKHHPDKGGDEEKFKLCAEAFGILSDDTKRRRYDMGADDPEAEPGMGGFHGHGPEVNLADLFAAHGGMGGGGFGGGHGPSPFGFAGASGGGFPGGGGGGARRSYRPPPNFNF